MLQSAGVGRMGQRGPGGEIQWLGCLVGARRMTETQPLRPVPPGEEGRSLPALPSLHLPVSPQAVLGGSLPEAGVWELGFPWAAHVPAEAGTQVDLNTTDGRGCTVRRQSQWAKKSSTLPS